MQSCNKLSQKLITIWQVCDRIWLTMTVIDGVTTAIITRSTLDSQWLHRREGSSVVGCGPLSHSSLEDKVPLSLHDQQQCGIWERATLKRATQPDCDENTEQSHAYLSRLGQPLHIVVRKKITTISAHPAPNTILSHKATLQHFFGRLTTSTSKCKSR